MNPEGLTPSLTAGGRADAIFPTRAGSVLGMRVLSLLGLAATAFGIGYTGIVVYRLLSDSFVAPIILSRDSDLVIQSKLSLSRLLAEREAIVARMTSDATSVEAGEKASVRLRELRMAAEKGLDWALAITSQQSRVGARDSETLAAQKSVLEKMIADQELVVAERREHLANGMIHKAEVEREEVALSQMRVAALDNERNRLANGAQRQAALLAQRSLRNPHAPNVASTPEVVAQQDQLVKLDLEILKLEAEARSKRVQLRSDEHQLEKLDGLVAEMKLRPIFRAIESNQNVAFVPYTQIDGVAPNAAVYSCSVWGLFFCQAVGTVAELVPGEVLAQDPWGTPMRGRYATLALRDARAAEAQSLRVRLEPDLWSKLKAKLRFVAR